MARTRQPGPFGLSRVGARRQSGSRPRRHIRDGITHVAVTETVDIVNVSAPEIAVPGETVTIRVSLRCQGPPLVGACEAAVRLSGPTGSTRVPQSGGQQFSEGSNNTFTAQLPMGTQDMPITIEALERGDAAGVWNVEDTSDITIQSGTQTEATVSRWGPWVIGGGAAGLGGALALDEDPLMGVGVGAGVGVGVKVVSDRFPTISIPNVGLVELALGGVVLFAGLNLIKRFQDPEVTGFGIGDTVGQAVGGASRTVGRLRGS